MSENAQHSSWSLEVSRAVHCQRHSVCPNRRSATWRSLVLTMLARSDPSPCLAFRPQAGCGRSGFATQRQLPLAPAIRHPEMRLTAAPSAADTHQLWAAQGAERLLSARATGSSGPKAASLAHRQAPFRSGSGACGLWRAGAPAPRWHVALCRTRRSRPPGIAGWRLSCLL